METLSKPNTTNDHLDIDSILAEIFTEGTEKDQSNNKSTANNNEDATLYQLLDELSGTRKLMSCLFGPAQEINLSTKDNKFTLRTIKFGEEWYGQEHTTVDSSSASRALRSDTPVYFSWSHDSKRKSRPSSPMKMPQQQPPLSNSSSVITEIQTKKILNNQRLLSAATEQMKYFKKSPSSWEDILNDEKKAEQTNSNEDIVTTNLHPEYKENISIGKSTFKVNPLAKFVAQELPKSKKHEDKSPSKSHHSKSKLWFWGSKKSKKKNKEKKISDRNSEDSYSKSKNNEHPVIDASSSNKEGISNSNIEERHSTSNVLNELFEDDPISQSDSDSAIGYLQSQTTSTLELQLTNTNTNNIDTFPSETTRADAIDLVSSFEAQRNQNSINDTVQTEENNNKSVEINTESNSEDDSEDDFGNFEQAEPQILDLPPPPPPSKMVTAVTVEHDNTKSTNITEEFTEVKPSNNDNANSNSSINLMMNSFVPLQPSKK
ncbi:similar to Naumovozyma castellii NCAS_0H02870 hypothetical protein [Maudiozyma saulgeensis]|uniref:Uncharacterized protein n=1 Tax=Maudiozyma saulgeensis TaxID=1789683 RepID=A0A1X7QX99_9SACH|nr:similar to Naumovozyma castellii NCAS_0H02870 hypothetical protein [Kazachstania saulgeensis]